MTKIQTAKVCKRLAFVVLDKAKPEKASLGEWPICGWTFLRCGTRGHPIHSIQPDSIETVSRWVNKNSEESLTWTLRASDFKQRKGFYEIRSMEYKKCELI